MAGKPKGAGPTASRKGKVRKEFWLNPRLLKEAQTMLGTTTERETVEVALDLVAFRAELRQSGAALAGLNLRRLE